jgi:hypothetical protein
VCEIIGNRRNGRGAPIRVHRPEEKCPALMGLIALAAMIFIPVAAFGAPAPANEVCLSCHSVPGLEKERQGKKVSLTVDPQRFSQSVHAPLPCTACHSDISQVPHAAELKPVQCAQCHAQVAEEYGASVHGRAQLKGDRDAATCSDCHGKHEIVPAKNPQSKVYPLQLPYTCGTCHGDAALAKKHNIPVTNAYKLYMDSIHGRALEKSGLLVAANCTSCHGSHRILPRLNPLSTVNRRSVPDTCGKCHAGVLKIFENSVHGKAFAANNPAAPVCIDCHTAHEIKRIDLDAWKLEIVRECGTCHAQSLKTYRDSFHGQVTALGFTRVARCSDCHGSHDVLPKADPRSSVNANRIVGTCQRCHPSANANFAKYDPHADAADRARNPVLYFTARFMTGLLFGVFVFFGLHTALWAGRPLFARIRKIFASGHRNDGPSKPG